MLAPTALAGVLALISACGGSGGGAVLLEAPTISTSHFSPLSQGASVFITLPEFTKTTGQAIDFPAIYSLAGLPDWLQFIPELRLITLADGVINGVPADCLDPIRATYSCTSQWDPTLTASVEFTLNDIDGGGVTDGQEELFRTPPYMAVGLPFGGINNGYGVNGLIERGLDPYNQQDDTADLDGDGISNLDEIANGTSIFIPQTSAQLTAEITQPCGAGPTDVVFMNYDLFLGSHPGNHRLDLVTVNSSSITLLQNGGGNDFSLRQDTNTGPLTGAVAVTRLSTSGWSNDLILPNSNTNSAYVYEHSNVLDGSFFHTTTLNDIAFGESVSSVLQSEWFVVGAGANQIHVIYKGQSPVSYAKDAGTSHLLLGDFNEDDNWDIVATNFESDTVSVFLSNAGFQSGYQNALSVSGFNGPNRIASADFNGDGHLDLAITNRTAGNIQLLWGDGHGSFALGPTIIVGTTPAGIVAGDWDGDGDADIANTNEGSGTVSIMLNQGDGSFATETPLGVGINL